MKIKKLFIIHYYVYILLNIVFLRACKLGLVNIHLIIIDNVINNFLNY